jgi:hypothetical protein
MNKVDWLDDDTQVNESAATEGAAK